MSNNVIANTVTLTGQEQKLVDRSLVCSFRLTASPDNLGSITVSVAGSGSYQLGPGSCSEFYRSVDLRDFSVIGTAGYEITYDGGTW